LTALRVLSAEDAARHRAALTATLVDCVHGGASVGFMASLTQEEADEWWGGIIESVARGETVLLGADLDGELVGTVQLVPSGRPNQRHRADVAKLLVHRRARGRGLAKALMAALEDEARRRGRTLLTLDTCSGSQAERLYAGLGWTRAGVIPNYALWPDGRSCDTVIFWKALS